MVGSYRSVKFETLVRKLKDHNENIKAQLENLTKQLSNTQKAINELNDEFPQAIGAMNAELGGSSKTGIGYSSDDTPNKAYSCDINITYGQTDPLSFEGTFGAKDEAGTKGDRTSYPGANFIYDINGMTPMNFQGLRGFAINDYYNNPQLDVFLRSCGRYTEEQVTKIMNDIYTANSDLVQKLAAKGTGTFEDFVTISGGSATIDTTKVTIVDYSTEPPTVLPRAE